jgi:uncharacterized spore protein YtfJ
MSIQHILDRLAERLHATASAGAVFGEPINGHQRTIIPVARAGYGLGGGSGHCSDDTENDPDRDEDDGGSGGEGLGVGAGGGAQPLGVFEVTDDDTRFIPVQSSKKVWLIALAALLIGWLIGRRR